MFNALRHRNLRIYLAGQFVSLIGTWMQQLATSWMVYRLTQSPFWLGVSVFATLSPNFILGLFAGIVVDRCDRQKLLMWTQSLLGAQALALAVLSYTGTATLAYLIILNVISGVINAFDMPARQSFVVQMISDRKDLPNAIALNSSVMNGTRMLGPAVAGATIAALGESACFLINAFSYLAVLIALGAMKLENSPRPAAELHWKDSLLIGFQAAFGHPLIRNILIYLAFMSLFGMPYNTLFPAMAAQIQGDGAKTLGAITATAGAGSLAAALYLARRSSITGMERLLGWSGMIFGLGLIAISRTHQLALILPCLFIVGLGMMIQLASANTIVQTLVDDDKRGRIMGLFIFALLGTAPFGSLFMGWLAQKIGVSETLALAGALSCAGTLWYLARLPKKQPA